MTDLYTQGPGFIANQRKEHKIVLKYSPIIVLIVEDSYHCLVLDAHIKLIFPKK